MDVAVPRGCRLPLGGISWVGTMPGYTRQGMLTGLVAAQLRDMWEREEPVGGLWASESTIYERFGFGAATWSIGFTLPRVHAELRPHPRSATAPSVGFLATESVLSTLPPIYDRFARGDAGSLARNEGWWHVHHTAPPTSEQTRTVAVKAGVTREEKLQSPSFSPRRSPRGGPCERDPRNAPPVAPATLLVVPAPTTPPPPPVPANRTREKVLCPK